MSFKSGFMIDWHIAVKWFLMPQGKISNLETTLKVFHVFSGNKMYHFNI